MPEGYTPQYGNKELPENAKVLNFVSKGYRDLHITQRHLFLWNPNTSYLKRNGAWGIDAVIVTPYNTAHECRYSGLAIKQDSVATTTCTDGSVEETAITKGSVIAIYMQKLLKVT